MGALYVKDATRVQTWLRAHLSVPKTLEWALGEQNFIFSMSPESKRAAASACQKMLALDRNRAGISLSLTLEMARTSRSQQAQRDNP